jgi:anti-anti-sigma factor
MRAHVLTGLMVRMAFEPGMPSHLDPRDWVPCRTCTWYVFANHVHSQVVHDTESCGAPKGQSFGGVDIPGRDIPEAAMKIETRNIYDVLVVDMSGKLDSTSSGDAGDRIVDIAKGAHKRVLLNLEKLEYLSSAGLRVILRGAKLLQVHQGELKICNATGLVRNVLETSGFNSLIKIYDTEKEAFSAFHA